MRNYKFGEIVEVAFPFEESEEKKVRPALVIEDCGESFLLLKITSKHKGRKWDVEIPKDAFNGLSVNSVIQVDKCVRLKKNELCSIIPRGILNEIQIGIIKMRLREYILTSSK